MSDKLQYLAYYDDDDSETIVKGYFNITKITNSYVEFVSRDNVVRIPWHRVLKNKEKVNRK